MRNPDTLSIIEIPLDGDLDEIQLHQPADHHKGALKTSVFKVEEENAP